MAQKVNPGQLAGFLSRLNIFSNQVVSALSTTVTRLSNGSNQLHDGIHQLTRLKSSVDDDRYDALITCTTTAVFIINYYYAKTQSLWGDI